MGYEEYRPTPPDHLAGRGDCLRRNDTTASLNSSGCSMFTMWPAFLITTFFAPLIPFSSFSSVALICGTS